MNLFGRSLSTRDTEIDEIIKNERTRAQKSIELIASENIVSQGILEAQGSILTNKYAEGYPGRRYYGGCKFADDIENLAIARLKKIFSANFANVQPHSGSQANQAVFFSLLKPGDKIVSLSLDSGGHLSHGSEVNISGKWFNVVHYHVDSKTYLIDYDQVEKIVRKERPKLLIAGGSAYPRNINFQRFREIADTVGCLLLADIAHISGLIAAKLHNNPLPHAHIVTSTTHKTLRGPRGGVIMTNHECISKKINTAIFPGLQGGPLMHVIAAKAVAFREALQPEFVEYIHQVLVNARCLAAALKRRGYEVLTGGTDTHLLLLDLRNKNITGKTAEESLERSGITCNKNCIPFDVEKPSITSGIRLGSPAATSRGFKENEFYITGNLIADVLDDLNTINSRETEMLVLEKVITLCNKFPLH